MGHFYSVGSLLQWPALTQPRLWMWFLFERWIGGPRGDFCGVCESPRAGRLGGAPAVLEQSRQHLQLAPEVFEPMRRQLGVAHRVLDVFVAEPHL